MTKNETLFFSEIPKEFSKFYLSIKSNIITAIADKNFSQIQLNDSPNRIKFRKANEKGHFLEIDKTILKPSLQISFNIPQNRIFHQQLKVDRKLPYFRVRSVQDFELLNDKIIKFGLDAYNFNFK